MRLTREFLILSSLTLVACKPKASDVKSMALNPSTRNIALVLGGDDSGGIAAGVAEDLRIMPPILRESLSFTDVREQANISLDKINEMSAQAASDLLQVPDGTLFWFITTHGSPQGDLSLSDGNFTTFNDIANKMRLARKDVAFKRLIVFIEACFSGQNINGQVAINPNTGSQSNGNGGGSFDYGYALDNLNPMLNPVMGPQPDNLLMRQQMLDAMMRNQFMNGFGNINPALNPTGSPVDLTPHVGKLYEQLIVIASSSGDEYSYVNGDGSNAVKAFQTSLEKLRSQPSATIEQFCQDMAGGTSDQSIQCKFDPPAVSTTPLFNTTGFGTTPPLY